MSDNNGFVVINNIRPIDSYAERMETLFRSRKRAIDKVAGFRSVRVLKPRTEEEAYLVISEWDSEEAYLSWTQSDAFREGHKRAFADMEQARQNREPEPMHAQFKMYDLLTD